MATIYLVALCLLAIFVEANIDNGQLWLTSENRIHISSAAQNKTIDLEDGRHILGLSNPERLADNSFHVFVSELGQSGPSVYQVSPSQQSVIVSANDIGKSSALYMESLTYDVISKTLYLTSRNARAIYTLSSEPGAKLRTLDIPSEKSPSGITIDSCSRKLFWTNSDRSSPSVESYDLETGDQDSIVTTNLSRPLATCWDPWEERLYWSDTRRGQFYISRVTGAGGERELVYTGHGHDVFSLTVDTDHVYWSDRASYSVWRVSKHGPDQSIELVKSFPSSKPHGIVFIPDSDPACRPHQSSIIVPPTPGSEQETTTDAPVEAAAPVSDGNCTNYCLYGDCFLDSDDSATCDCYEGWSGSRCQVDQCHNYCLHQASCVILESEPECLCPPGYHGDRCQRVSGDTDLCSTDTVTMITLTTVSGVLIIVVIVLSFMVHRLRVRPKIVRKRFISIGPAHTGHSAPGDNIGKEKRSGSCGGSALPVQDGIEFDIENCCNMTLCETPCFEPPTRGPKKSRRSKSCASDKKSLLDDCDED